MKKNKTKQKNPNPGKDSMKHCQRLKPEEIISDFDQGSSCFTKCLSHATCPRQYAESRNFPETFLLERPTARQCRKEDCDLGTVVLKFG
jgi:hypothetical protein